MIYKFIGSSNKEEIKLKRKNQNVGICDKGQVLVNPHSDYKNCQIIKIEGDEVDVTDFVGFTFIPTKDTELFEKTRQHAILESDTIELKPFVTEELVNNFLTKQFMTEQEIEIQELKHKLLEKEAEIQQLRTANDSLVYKWLLTAKKQRNEVAGIPKQKEFQLSLNLILEELSELAESGGEEMYKYQMNILLLKAMNIYVDLFGDSKMDANTCLRHFLPYVSDVLNLHIYENKPKFDKKELKTGDKWFRDAIADLQVVIANAKFFSGFSEVQFQDDFEEVMENNFSKFSKTYEEMLETEQHYRDKGIEVISFTENGHFVTLRLSDGKILKPKNYKDVELS